MRRRDLLTGSAAMAAYASLGPVGDCMSPEVRMLLLGNSRVPVRAVGTRTRLADTIDTSRFEYMSESLHVIQADTNVIGIVEGGYYSGADCAEVFAGSDGLVTSSVYRLSEGPAFAKQITWGGGQTQGTITNGKNVVSDLVPFRCHKGDSVLIRRWRHCPNGVPVCADTVMSSVDKTNRGVTTADLTMSGTAMSSTGVASSFPYAVLGLTHADAYGLIGDSRTYGRNDTYDTTYEIGELCRAVGQLNGYVNVSRRTMSIRQFLASSSLRMELINKYCTRVICNLAVNDLYNEGKSVAQIEALLGSLWSAAPNGMIVYQTTITPYTTGAWTAADGSDQTGPSGFPIDVLNGWLRAGGLPVRALIDHAQAVQLSGNAAKWHPSWTSDGLHAIQAGMIAIRDSGIIQAAIS